MPPMLGTELLRAAALLGLCGLTASAAHAAPPDLTGMWSTPFRVHASGFPLMGGSTMWIPLSKGDPAKAPMMSLDKMSALVDKSVREHHGNPMFGLPPPPPPPYNAKGREIAAKIDPEAVHAQEIACYPSNVLWRIGFGPMQVVQGNREIAMIADGALARTIYLDGRSEKDALPQWSGHSVGEWKGDTLVIDVTSIRGDTFGLFNWPMTEAATVHEEYHLVDGGKRLALMESFFDPTYYTEPMRRLVYLDRKSDAEEVLDYTCEEGKADMIEMQAKPRP